MRSPTVPFAADSTGEQIHRRRTASYRLAPLDDGRQDPLENAFRGSERSSFGLGVEELRAEVRRCEKAGWQPWEIEQRFTNPRLVQASLDRAHEADRILHPEMEYAV